MKTLRKIFYVACTAFFLASCEETYNDKLFWPGEISQEYGSYIKPQTLNLTYSGEKLIGKTVCFKSENSETGMMTLNDIIPGEKETVISGIQLLEMGDLYTFCGEATTTTGATVRYNGSITPKALSLELNTRLSDKENFATTYQLNDYMADIDNYIISGGFYGEMIPKAGEEGNLTLLPLFNALLPTFLNQILPQVIQNIQLGPDGNITADYSSDVLNMEDIMNVIPTETMPELIDSRNYLPSPKGLAFWSKTETQLLLKLNLPAIITQITKSGNQNLDPKLIAGVVEALLKSDPNRLKSVLTTINAIVDNQILEYILKTDNATFTALFSYLKDGIPMNITYPDDGSTYLSLDYQILTPIIHVLSGIVIDFSGLTIDLSLIANDWKLLQTFNIGLKLMPQQNN